MSIILIGYPGSGKSTIAPLLAHELGWEWKDTDAVVEVWWEVNHGNFVPYRDLFRKLGEEGYRNLEERAIRQLSNLLKTVIATGGGTPLRAETAALLKALGTIIYLKQEAPTRVDPTAAFYKKHLLERASHYAAIADIIIEINDEEPLVIVKRIMEVYGG